MPAISFSGLASGLDSDAIVNSLLDVARLPQIRIQQQNQFSQSKIGILDNISSALSELRTTANTLDTVGEFLSYSSTVSDDSVAKVSAGGEALPGTYSLEVSQLATAQRTYSDTVADQTAALSGSDQTLSITIDGETTDIDVTAGESLQDVAAAINGSGAAVTAGIIFDGNDYRLAISGQDTGAANAITFADTGLGLGLETPANTVQAATDASFSIDGFTITSASNIVDSALPGVTLELTGTTTSAETLSIATDTEAVTEKVQAFVDAYNSVMSLLNDQVGEGLGRETLSGDATVRTIESGLSNLISNPIPGMLTPSGDTMQLGDLGISTATDGTLTLDAEDLAEALAQSANDTASYFSGQQSGSTDGIGQLVADLVDGYTSAEGLLTTRKEGLQSLIENNDDQIESIERYLESYEENLRAQFTALESSMSALQNQQSYLAQFLNS